MLKYNFYIRCVITNMYFWQYRIDEGFNADIGQARGFNSEEDAENCLRDVAYAGEFEGKFLVIEKFFRVI